MCCESVDTFLIVLKCILNHFNWPQVAFDQKPIHNAIFFQNRAINNTTTEPGNQKSDLAESRVRKNKSFEFIKIILKT